MTARVMPVGWDADGCPVVEFPVVDGCCGDPCSWDPAIGHEDGPCWGVIRGIGDDWDEETNDETRWHACTGHAGMLEGPYVAPAQPAALLP